MPVLGGGFVTLSHATTARQANTTFTRRARNLSRMSTWAFSSSLLQPLGAPVLGFRQLALWRTCWVCCSKSALRIKGH